MNATKIQLKLMRRVSAITTTAAVVGLLSLVSCPGMFQFVAGWTTAVFSITVATREVALEDAESKSRCIESYHFLFESNRQNDVLFLPHFILCFFLFHFALVCVSTALGAMVHELSRDRQAPTGDPSKKSILSQGGTINIERSHA